MMLRQTSNVAVSLRETKPPPATGVRPPVTAEQGGARRLHHAERDGCSARRRRSFTLVELLITIAIISILASTIVFTMIGAREKGNQAYARSQIVRIGELLARRWQDYGSRPMPIRIPPNISGQQAALYRLNALRELMRMEFPDRRTDIDPNLPASAPVWLVPPLTAQPTYPALARTYQRRIQQAAMTSGTPWTPQYENAECLYLILANMRDGDGVALDHFKASEFGDLDNDGMPEILDPWGAPIQFIRWPYQLRSAKQDGNPTLSPDPFDPFRAGVANYNMSAPNFALVPFVFSAGPDGMPGYSVGEPGFAYSTTLPLRNDPYAPMDGAMLNNTAGQRLGSVANDDIHSHLTE
jgi:prepilin-type N-terminal cleavage/methylation domain-containing protein